MQVIKRHPVRVYADTSVFGGVFDEEFKKPRRTFFEMVKAGIVTVKCLDDALHVALATISGCGLIVSWNFKHIVNFKKIPLYNGINGANGYPSISIHSPLEVINDEK